MVLHSEKCSRQPSTLAVSEPGALQPVSVFVRLQPFMVDGSMVVSLTDRASQRSKTVTS